MKFFASVLCLAGVLSFQQSFASDFKVNAFLGDDTAPFASRGRLDFGNVKRGSPTTKGKRVVNLKMETL